MKGLKKFFAVLLIGLPCNAWAKKTAHQENKKQPVKSYKDVPRNRLAELPHGPKAETLSYYISSSKTLSELKERVNILARSSNAMETFLHTREAGMVIIAQRKKILGSLQQELDGVIKWEGVDRVNIIGKLSLEHPNSNINGRSQSGQTVLVQLLNFDPNNIQQQKRRMLLLKQLLLNGIQINKPNIIPSTEMSDMTPLMKVAYWGNIEAAQLLLSHAHDGQERKLLVNMVDASNDTALKYTFENPHPMTKNNETVFALILQVQPSVVSAKRTLIHLNNNIETAERAQRIAANQYGRMALTRRIGYLTRMKKLLVFYIDQQTKWWRRIIK